MVDVFYEYPIHHADQTGSMMSCRLRIIIQSRISSQRLPAKALLPIAGFPSVALCALRARNTGRDVVLATSTTAEDDNITEVIESFNIPIFHGTLDDVLNRYVEASKDLQDDDYIVRLTADNMFPDGALIDRLWSAVQEPRPEHFVFQRGLPFGTGFEIIKVARLREAADSTVDRYDREHVTPWIGRNCDTKTVEFPQEWRDQIDDWSHLRTTMDSLSDYIRIKSVFDCLEEDPVKVSWHTLSRSMLELFGHRKPILPVVRHSRVITPFQLGSAQLGDKYGVANEVGEISDNEAARILRTAMDMGISEIETARDYNVAESRIGSLIPNGDVSRFQVTTKLSCLKELNSNASDSEVRHAVDASVYASCRALRLQKLPVIFLHRSEHVKSWDGAVIKRLIELQGLEVVGDIGVSIYEPDELDIVMSTDCVNHIQLPFNVLDHRWLANVVTRKIDKLSSRVVFSVRSALLQGLLTLPAERWPVPREKALQIVSWLGDMTVACRRQNVRDMCFAFVRSFEWVTKIVVGVDSVQQLKENIDYFKNPPLDDSQRSQIIATLPEFPLGLVDPRTWFS